MSESALEKWARLRPKTDQTKALVDQAIALYDAISNTNSAVVEPLSEIYSVLMRYRFDLERLRERCLEMS